MTIDWTQLLPGLLLLLYPADRLLSARVHLRSFESFMCLENSPRFRPWWWVPVLWLDPLRGYFGTWLLLRAFAMEELDWTLLESPFYWVLIVVLAAATLCQTLTRGDRDGLLAPIGFTTGIVAALLPLEVALIGLVAALMGLFAFRRFHAFFTVGLPMITLLTLLFQARPLWLAPALVVLAVPLLTGLFTSKTLEIPTRNDSGRKDDSTEE
jgi:hypothetical protein